MLFVPEFTGLQGKALHLKELWLLKRDAGVGESCFTSWLYKVKAV